MKSLSRTILKLTWLALFLQFNPIQAVGKTPVELLCLKEVAPLIQIGSSHTFDISNCDSPELAIADTMHFMLRQSSHDFNWYENFPVDFAAARSLLAEDHFQFGGDRPICSEELHKLQQFYRSSQVADKVHMAEYAESHTSGTGIYAIVFLFTSGGKHMVIIPKLTYVE